MTTYTAPAKINLSLRVQSKLREDGYHNVDILMAAIDLYDQLDFHNSRTTTLLCDTPGVPTDESNLVIKAIREFEKSYGRKAKQRITLKAVNEIIGTNYDMEELGAMAANLGSDVNFFLNPVISRCTGRGEIVKPVPELAEWSSPLVLIKPQFGVSTPSAYKALTCSKRFKSVNYGAQKVDGITFTNELERPVFAKFPILGIMKMWLLQQEGVRVALMSGSGSSLFALTETPEQAQAIATLARAEFGDSLFTHCGTVNPQ